MSLVGFTQAEVSTEATGPSLPEAIIRTSVLSATQAAEVIGAEYVLGRPVVAVTSYYPVADDSEVQRNAKKTRSTYGLATGVKVPLKDPEGNLLSFTGRLFASVPKEDGENEATD